MNAQRAAGIGALACGSAAVTALGGVLAIGRTGIRFSDAVRPQFLPDADWSARWLADAISAASQQQAAAEQWLHVILLFGGLTIAVAGINAVIAFVAWANERRYDTALHAVVGAPVRSLRAALRRAALHDAAVGVTAGCVLGGTLAVAAVGSFRLATVAPWALLAVCAAFTTVAFAAHRASRSLARAGWLGDALAPAARSRSRWPVEDLRAVLNAAQLACAVALTTVSLLVWSYTTVPSAAPEPAHAAHVSVARVTLSAASSATERASAIGGLLARIARGQGVDAESIASPGALLGIGRVDKVVAECRACARAGLATPLLPVETQHHVVGAGFFRTAGIALHRGSEFGRAPTDARAVVVNDAFARAAFAGSDPIGRRILVGGFGGAWYRVIGVAADVPATGLHFMEDDPLTAGMSGTRHAPAIYFAADAHPPAAFDVVVRGRLEAPVLAGLAFEPVTRMRERAGRPQQVMARAITLLGLLLGATAVTGTFVLVLLSVEARRFEIALRRALGARRSAAQLFVYREVAVTVLRGIVAGLIVSAALTRVIAVFLPGLPAFDARIALGVGSAFAAIAVLAALAPLRRVARVPPAEPLA